MTIQYTMDVNHSTLLAGNGNRLLFAEVKNLLLNDVGLANLNKDISCEDTVKAIFENLAGIHKPEGAKPLYQFNSRTGEHIFLLHSYKVIPARVQDMLTHIPKDRTSIRLTVLEKAFILRVNSRFYPLSGVNKITSVPTTLNLVFNGPLFIRRISESRFVPDSKDVWSLAVADIRNSLAALVEVVNTDIKKYWGRAKFNPPDALFIAGTLLENLHALMVIARVNHNYAKFEAVRYNDKLVCEALASAHNSFNHDKSVLNFIQIAIYMVGQLLERLIANDYQHLLKGFLK